MIFPIITFPYVSRILGPEGTGAVNFAQNYCQYFIFIGALGIPVYGVREISKAKDNITSRSKLFFEINLIRIFTTLIALIPYFIIVSSSQKFLSNISLYYWGAVYILLNITSIEWFFTGIEKFKYITNRTLIIKCLSIILLFIFVKEKEDIIPYFLITILTIGLNGVINIKYAISYISLKRINFDTLEFKKHFKPLFHIFGGIAAITIYVLLDTIILGFLASDKAVGFYTVASRICKIGVTILVALGTVLIPRISYAVSQKNQVEIDRLISKSFTFVLTFGIPMSMGVLVTAPELIFLFSGREFESAVTTIQIICPTIFIIGLANIFSMQILTPLSKDKFIMYAAITGAVISFILNFLLVPILQQNGTAIANLSAQLLVAIVLFYYAKQFMKFKFPYKILIQCTLACLPIPIISTVCHILFNEEILIITFIMIISGLSFSLIQYYIFKNEIISEIVSMVSKRIFK